MKRPKRKGMDIVIEERSKGTISYGYCRIEGCNFDFPCPICGAVVPANTEHECEQGKRDPRLGRTD